MLLVLFATLVDCQKAVGFRHGMGRILQGSGVATALPGNDREYTTEEIRTWRYSSGQEGSKREALAILSNSHPLS